MHLRVEVEPSARWTLPQLINKKHTTINHRRLERSIQPATFSPFQHASWWWGIFWMDKVVDVKYWAYNNQPPAGWTRQRLWDNKTHNNQPQWARMKPSARNLTSWQLPLSISFMTWIRHGCRWDGRRQTLIKHITINHREVGWSLQPVTAPQPLSFPSPSFHILTSSFTDYPIDTDDCFDKSLTKEHTTINHPVPVCIIDSVPCHRQPPSTSTSTGPFDDGTLLRRHKSARTGSS